jgi:hypothetical protein
VLKNFEDQNKKVLGFLLFIVTMKRQALLIYVTRLLVRATLQVE